MYRREEGHWPGEPPPFFCSNEIVPLLRREHFCNKPRRIFRKKGSHFQNQPQRVVPVCWSSSHPQLSNPSSRPWTSWTRAILIYRLSVKRCHLSYLVLVEDLQLDLILGAGVDVQLMLPDRLQCFLANLHHFFILKILTLQTYRTSFLTLVSYRWFS